VGVVKPLPAGREAPTSITAALAPISSSQGPPALPCIPEPSKIHFLHPHYDGDWHDPLLSLPKLDTAPGSFVPSGVHHRTALLACQIVANNAFRGYLATDRYGAGRVTIGHDNILTQDNYWLIADPGNPRYDYPVVPSFEDWAFPSQKFSGLRWRCPEEPSLAQRQRPPSRLDHPSAAQNPPSTSMPTPPFNRIRRHISPRWKHILDKLPSLVTDDNASFGAHDLATITLGYPTARIGLQ
jgi:hypothetical protein